MAGVRAPYIVCGSAVNVGTSVGIKVVKPGQEVDPPGVQAGADMALYEAKAVGKGQAVFAKAA